MRVIISILFIGISILSFSQKKFTTRIGLGIGSVHEEKFPGCEKRERNRISLSISQYMSLGSKYSIGIEAMTSGDIWYGNRAECDVRDVAANTTTYNYNNSKADNFFIRTRYTFDSEKKLRPFVSIGVGVIDYFYNNVTADEGRVDKLKFGVSPELGVTVSDFDISLKMILGGETPSYSGFDSHSNSNVSLSSIESQQLYINVAYPIFRF